MSKKSTFSERNLLPEEELAPVFKFSDQSIGAVMMALQKCLMEQSDITDILKNFEFKMGPSGALYVLNPPLVKFEDDTASG